MHSETTSILDMSSAARVERRHTERAAENAAAEQEAISKLVGEGWVIAYDVNGNWSATKEVI